MYGFSTVSQEWGGFNLILFLLLVGGCYTVEGKMTVDDRKFLNLETIPETKKEFFPLPASPTVRLPVKSIPPIKLLFVLAPDWKKCEDIRSSLELLDAFSTSTEIFSQIHIASVSPVVQEDCFDQFISRERQDDNPIIKSHSYTSLQVFFLYLSEHQDMFDFVLFDSIELAPHITEINPIMQQRTILRIDEVSPRKVEERSKVCWTEAQQDKLKAASRDSLNAQKSPTKSVRQAAARTALERRSVLLSVSHIGPQYFRNISDEQVGKLEQFGMVVFTSESVRSLYAEWDKGHFETIRNPVPMPTSAFLSSFQSGSVPNFEMKSKSGEKNQEVDEDIGFDLQNVFPLENVFEPEIEEKIANELRRVRSQIMDMGRSSLGLYSSPKSVVTITISRSACASEVNNSKSYRNDIRCVLFSIQ